MYCQHCGTDLPDSAKFCRSCGKPQEKKPQEGQGSLAGFSSKINDPAFAKYIKANNKWSVIFSLILAIAAVIGFFIYGETSAEMENPQALYIGLGIGGMFLVIALFQILGRKRSKNWDGTVVDKKIKNKQRRQYTSEDDYYLVDYKVYIVAIKSDDGKKHEIRNEDDDTVYNYYQIGDRVRHHKGLNTYEKYDKSKDRYILCNACSSLNDIHDDYCFRCKCPLLK